MIKSFFKTGLRNILKSKLHSLISIVGLGLSICVCIFLGHIIFTELTYDAFHLDASNIYRLTLDETRSGRPGARHFPRASPPAGPEFKSAFPEIEEYVRLRYSPSDILRYQDKVFYEFGIFYADSTFFKVFSFDLTRGDERSALRLANSIIISKSIAEKYFGSEDPIGKTFRLNNERDFVVTGIFSTLPINSHLQFEIILPFHSFQVPFGYPVDLNSWSWASFNTYFRLKNGTDSQLLERKLITYAKSNLPEAIHNRFDFKLQPLADIYFGDLKTDEIKSGNKSFVMGLAIVGGIILLISSMNFININSTRILVRSKESGVRKVLGASQFNFYTQYVSETTILTLISCLLGLTLFYLLDVELKSFFQINHFSVTSLLLPTVFISLVISLFLGLLSGFYPALISSNMEVVKMTKGELKDGKTGVGIRRALIFSQLVITAVLLSCMTIVYKQLEYLGSQDLGFYRNNVLILDVLPDELNAKGDLFKSEIVKFPWIDGVASSGTNMVGNAGNVPIYPEGNQFDEGYPMPIIAVTPGWIELLKLTMISGQSFVNKFPVDSTEVIINEAATKIFNWIPDEALGKRIKVGELLEGRISGVVKDFNYASLHDEITPLVLFHPITHLSHLYIRLNTDNISDAIIGIEATWNNVFTASPFYYHFLDQTIENQYARDVNFQRMLFCFSILGLIIAITGLYSFINFMIALKRKEIALRKILGCTNQLIYYNLLKPFALMVLLSFAISIPLSLFFIMQWLNKFAYKIIVDPFLFFGLLIAFQAVVALVAGIPVIRLIRLNPIKYLREE